MVDQGADEARGTSSGGEGRDRDTQGDGKMPAVPEEGGSHTGSQGPEAQAAAGNASEAARHPNSGGTDATAAAAAASVPQARRRDGPEDNTSDVESEDEQGPEEASDRATDWEERWAYWDSVNWEEAWDDLDIPTVRRVDGRLRPALAVVLEEIVDRLGDESAVRAERAWKLLAYFPSLFLRQDRKGGQASFAARHRRIKAFWEGDFGGLVRLLRDDVVLLRERQQRGRERRSHRSVQQ
uniref:Uncharacterized protein n=1 Tax=Chromera velia CCMP2878 TaxID=1169474 RepID=A0A0G4IAN2_9ALVE|eukprot:Cvel_12496.t1-p1 / transcript=Cvel_12496.t1 / gene=Cvel_12496 / organism=Chromera_velia_CCMP2878 / gene_product=hypothetical protein / transcript_product=hypothetical protein / location=Cvel_scaffold820:5484-6197(+) / protein_length=238 / sequence_SO=supercontig / SO=protein_coding / is_pseudo=false